MLLQHPIRDWTKAILVGAPPLLGLFVATGLTLTGTAEAGTDPEPTTKIVKKQVTNGDTTVDCPVGYKSIGNGYSTSYESRVTRTYVNGVSEQVKPTVKRGGTAYAICRRV
ncbi:hypothetical protein Acor_33850 [Acrocarpospora corrugata]|uniref:Uncharacterized protein n=1 Tax=Acrocarpospora corrugata TaxID=35763 RepID=A0A5M3W2F9_9ACTN|nr:hypothetical protein [Acrocarpospora corrugata]GES01321.1 hypothetical protein Acor_33850 [Acrocarpospora corrugata]